MSFRLCFLSFLVTKAESKKSVSVIITLPIRNVPISVVLAVFTLCHHKGDVFGGGGVDI